MTEQEMNEQRKRALANWEAKDCKSDRERYEKQAIIKNLKRLISR